MLGMNDNIVYRDVWDKTVILNSGYRQSVLLL